MKECIVGLPHDVQCISRRPRVGSANGLKADSQPGSARFAIGLFVEMTSGWADWAIDGSDSRSPLVVRLTEIATTVALSAVEGLTSVLMTPAVKTLTTQAVVIFLSLSSKLLRIARLRRHSAVAFQKEIAFNASRQTKTAVSD